MKLAADNGNLVKIKPPVMSGGVLELVGTNELEELNNNILQNIDTKIQNFSQTGTVANALKLDGKSLEEIVAQIGSNIRHDTGWQEFTWKNTGGGNKGAIFKITVDFDIKYAIALLKHKTSGHIFLISSVASNIVPRNDNRDYGATVVIKNRTVGVGVGENGIPLGESVIYFSNYEGLDTFGEGANITVDADDFYVRVIVY